MYAFYVVIFGWFIVLYYLSMVRPGLHSTIACSFPELFYFLDIWIWHLLPFQAQLLILLCRLSFFSSFSNCCSECYICFSGSSLLSPYLKISFKEQLQLSFKILMTFRFLSAAQVFLSGSELISYQPLNYHQYLTFSIQRNKSIYLLHKCVYFSIFLISILKCWIFLCFSFMLHCPINCQNFMIFFFKYFSRFYP